MTVDYDLIILGGAAIGRYAAARAAQLGARVALIEPPNLTPNLTSHLLYQTLVQVNSRLRQQSWLDQWQEQSDQADRALAQAPPPLLTLPNLHAANLNWHNLRQWATAQAETVEVSSIPFASLSRLVAQGVEVILEPGAFYPRPRLGFSTANRSLRARRYLLAPASQPTIPSIPGLSTVPWVTLDTLAAQHWQTRPERLLILGNDPRGIALAQALNRLGTQITLITTAQQLLPSDDQDVALRLQAQLEAEGVMVLTQTQVTQIKKIGERLWVQAGIQALETEGILLATPPQLDLAALNLEAIDVKWQPQRIRVNRQLQTTHPRIYACGEGLGGYPHTAIDCHEANIALQNALFFAIHQVDYRFVPTVVSTDPQLIRIGLTEAQAKAMYGTAIQVIKQPLNALTKAQLCEDTGFCKLIALKSGEIVGAHCFGTEASEWISSLTLAMQHSIKLPALARLPAISPTLAEVIQQTAQSWQNHYRPEWQRELLETWFNFMRGR